MGAIAKRNAIIVGVLIVLLYLGLWHDGSPRVVVDGGASKQVARPAAVEVAAQPSPSAAEQAPAVIADAPADGTESARAPTADDLRTDDLRVKEDPPPAPFQECPERAPDDQTPCFVAEGTALNCGYTLDDEEVVCGCIPSETQTWPDTSWHCSTSEPGESEPAVGDRCPDTLPAQGSPCAPAHKLCSYATPKPIECVCDLEEGQSWQCARYGARFTK